MPQLYVRDFPEQFRAAEEERLRDRLRDLDVSQELIPVSRPEQLVIDVCTGLTQEDGYRLSASCVEQLAKLMMRGLWTVLVSFTRGAPAARCAMAVPPAPEEAVRLWNRVVWQRFSLLQQRRLLRNRQTRRVEGVVGATYRLLENERFYEILVDGLCRPTAVVFRGARLGSSKLSVWLREPQPIATTTYCGRPWAVYYGYYFSNTEITGASLVGTQALYTPFGVCWRGYTSPGGRVPHVGRRFAANVAALIVRLRDAEHLALSSAELQTRLGYELGYAAGMGAEQLADLTSRWEDRLKCMRWPRSLRSEILSDALTKGATDPAEQVLLSDRSRLYAGRNIGDILAATLRAARTAGSARVRESASLAAFQIVTGALTKQER